MASINKLSIRGVRSFSPEDAEQVLEFYMPLTVIVGANGCGKTTIIESLKFAVCGSLPPGNKSGQAFVHDPRSIGSAIVKANIKLRFTNRTDKTMVVVRSMEVQQKKTTMTFRQLDGVLRMTTDDGQRTSLSHKCTELDRQVPMLLGVSKAILENVVFCHQEESSWPLQEGAVLKKKFDDIFDSTRYSKALDVFSKLKKEYTIKTKDLKASVMEFRSHNHAAQGFQREIAKYNEQLEELEESLASGRQALKENEEEEKRIRVIQDQVEELESKIDQKNSDIALDRSVVSKHRSMLQEDLTGKHSLQELKDMLQSFDTKFEGRRDQKLELEAKMNALLQEVEKVREQQSEMQAQVGRLQAAKESHEKNLRERYEKMVEIGNEYGLGDLVTQISQNSQGSIVPGSQDTSFASLTQRSLANASTFLGSPMGSHVLSQQQPILDISQEDMNEYIRAVKRKQEELQEKQSDQKAQRKQQEENYSNEIMELKGKLRALENDRERILKEVSKTTQEITECRNKVSNVPRMRKATLDDTKMKAESAAKKRDAANANPRRTEIPTEIKRLTGKMEEIRVKLENDKSVQTELLQLQEHQIQIQQTKKNADAELDNLQEDIRLEVNADTWRGYNLTVPQTELPKREQDKLGGELKNVMEGVNREISERFQEKEGELSSTNDNVRRLTQIVSEKRAIIQQDSLSVANKTTRMVMLQESVDKIKRVVQEVRAFENRSKLPDLCETKPQELLDYLSKRLDNIEMESTEGVPTEIIKKLVRTLFKMGQKSGGEIECPCCKRDIETEAELMTYQSNLKTLVSDDSPLNRVDERTKMAKEKFQRWCEIVKSTRNDAMEYERLRVEVNEVENRIRAQEPALKTHDKELESANQSVIILKGEISELREMQNSSKQWNDAAMKIAGLREQVVQKEEDFRSMISDKESRDLKKVSDDIANLEKKKDEYIEKVNDLNSEMSKLNDEVSSLAQTATRLETNLRNMQEKYDEELKLEERKSTLTKRSVDLKTELEQLSEQIAPLKQKVDSKETQKTRALKLCEDEEEKTTEEYSKFSASVLELNRIMSAIDEYVKSSKAGEIANLEKENDRLTEKGKEKRKEHSKMKPELDRLTKMVDDHDRERKNLEENIQLIKATENIEGLRKDIAKLETELSHVEGRETLEEDEQQLSNRKNEIIANMARQDGRKGEIVESIRGLKRKLSQPEYRNVEEQYRIANIKHDTSEMAVKDIEKYHSALDKALQRYHSIKISEINTIIRDLWTLTYKGEDINNIEIVSGQESGSRSSRSYNYRVVMEKGGSRMDMRGRCSAGQRVLASIVIRLALAETFCVNFGCIALDEPTVNLDFKNKKGLAGALAQIIASRQQQSNFQLVLITHDEEFVVMMKNELLILPNTSMPEKYFQIHRAEGSDGKYYSKINAVDWEELL